MTAYWPTRGTQGVAVSAPPFALRRALIAVAALALLTQQLPALPTPHIEMSEVARPASLDAVPRGATGSIAPPLARPATLAARIAELPLAFEANRGQSDPAFDFMARGRGYAFGLGASKIVLALQPSTARGATADVLDATARTRSSAAHVVTLDLIGARPDARAVPMAALPGTVNYYIGNDPARWVEGVPTYARVRYEGVYPGVDVVHYGNGRQLEFDVVVAAGADPAAFALRVGGADRLQLRGTELVLMVAEGDLILRAPDVYQEIDGARIRVPARYVVEGLDRVAIAVDRYDTSRPLVIDPVLVYSTFLGGSGGDIAEAIEIDAGGNAYVVGTTSSTNFPAVNAAQSASGGGSDAFVAKLNAAGSSFLYKTYLGGAGTDFGLGLGVDGGGNAYVTGFSASANYPLLNAFDATTDGSQDAFVTKLGSSGALLFSSYFGGNSHDTGQAITTNAAGEIYVTGFTGFPPSGVTNDFPTTLGAYDTVPNGLSDAWVTKLGCPATPCSGTYSVAWSTLLGGGDSNEGGHGIAVDGAGQVHVVGNTTSTDFPTVNAYQTTYAGGSGLDLTYTKFNAAGSSILYSTYFGGTGDDRPNGSGSIRVDTLGIPYIAGSTQSTNFPTKVPSQSAFGGSTDAVVFKLNPAASGVGSLLFSTYLGGAGQDIAYGIDIDNSANVYVSGSTSLVFGVSVNNFPTTAGALKTCDNTFSDVFVSKIAPSDSALLYSSCAGGGGNDLGHGIAVDAGTGDVYLTGRTEGGFGSTAGSAQPTYAGGTDTFIAKLGEAPADLSITKTDGKVRVNGGTDLTYTITVANAGPNSATSVTVTDALPSSVTFKSSSASQGSCSGTSTVTCGLGTLASGATATVIITVSTSATAVVTNTATVSAATSDPSVANNSASDVTRVFTRSTGSLRAWGWNAFGQLGDSTTTERHTPVRVSAPTTGFIEVVGGSGNPHTLALRSDGTVWAWGDNSLGQLGNGTTTSSTTPLQVSGLTEIVAIAASAGSSFALRSDGKVFSWGGNGSAQLGNGTTTSSSTPVEVSGLTNVFAIGAGIDHALAVRSDGTAWAWGGNTSGQLGNGTTTSSATPAQVSGLIGIVAVSGGHHHSLVLRADGTVWGWGGNADGQVGDGTTTTRLTPVQVSGLTGSTAISAGNNHSLARRSDGTVAAWGDNGAGQLGNGTVTDSGTPVQVSGLSSVDGIAAGGGHSLALRSDGTVFGWGENANGRLGDGTTIVRTTPVQVSALTGVVEIEAAAAWSLAITSHVILSAQVRLDADVDGQLDAGEPLTNAASIKIFRVVGGTETLIASATNSPNITLSGVEAGTFKIVETDATNRASTNALPGVGGSKVDNNTILVVLAPGQISEDHVFLDREDPLPVIDAAPPTWPSGAALTTFRVGPKLVGFSWPTATDNVGVAAYKVFQNGALRATLGGSVTSYRAGALTSNTAYTFSVQACDAAGNCGPGPSLSITTPIGLNNYTWSKAYPVTPGVPVSEHLFQEGLSAWFKFSVKPDQRVEVTLTNLPKDYDLLLFKDIAAAYNASTSVAVQNAQLLDSALIDSALIDSALIDSALIDSALIDSALIDSSLIDSALIDSALIDSALIDSSLIDSALIDSALIDSSLIDSALIDSALIDSALIDSSLIDSSLIDSALIDSALIREASSGAARRSVLARSANVGTANERIARFTFDRTGDFYVRVRGKGGAFSLASPFQVQVNVQTGLCEGIAAVQTPPGGTVLSGVAGQYKRVIVWDASRIAGTAAEKAALETKLAAYAAQVGGVVVRMGQDSRVNAAHVQADAHVACPYAKNLVAAEIKRIIDSYRDLNPVEDVVLVGPDTAVPFWRHVDPPFGTERDYVPPTRHDSASEAALRKGLFLSQDRYGSRFTIERLGYTLPLQDIGVSRVIETAAEVSAQLDAYGLLTGGQIPIAAAPTALVTGYDFLIDFAQAVRGELQAGLGVSGVVDGALIGDSWTTNDLRAKILAQRYDFLSLGGHFSAFSTIGPDYDPAAKLRSTEVLKSSVNMEWSIVASPGCHVAFNVPDGDGISLVTPEPDWAQVAARKKFILVAGTGYQYGETELIEYSERLYQEFWKQLRTGTGAVSTSAALLGAKTAYRAKPLSADLHIKALLEATHFGLPVLVNMPGDRIAASGSSSIVGPVTAYASGPGANLSLSRADTGSLAFTLAGNTVSVRLPGATTDTTATYLTGGDGFVANPLEPVLPLELRNVRVPNTLLRGVGFRGASFTDTAGVLPLTSTPGTELGSAMVPFVSDVFYPVRPWGVNSLDGLTGGPVRLFVTPAQHRSGTPGSTSVVRRQLNDASFRLFYSAHTGAAATAGAHAIEAVTSAVDASGAGFIVRVGGDPRVGAQEVWITYTATSGPFAGVWQSLDLARASTGPAPGREIWTGALALVGQAPGNVLYFVQVTNGLGIVSMTTNGGAYFRLGPPPTLAPTSVVLQSPTASVSGPFGGTVSVSAVLRSGGSAVANAGVSFDLGGVRVRATTDATGTAAATIKLDRLPGTYELRALFGRTDTLERSQSAGVTVTVTKQSTAITLTPGSSASGQYSDPAGPILVATLREASARALALREETIYWVVSGNDDSGTARYFAAADITNDDGQAVLRIDAIPLPAGTYTITAHFSGPIPQASGPALVLAHALYHPTTASGSLTVTAEGATLTYTGQTVVAAGATLIAGATVTQDADAPGDITKTQVRFDVKDGAVVVATATIPVPANGQVAASFSGLATNVYAVDVTLLGGGFFAAPVVTALIAVYDPTGGFVTGGGWIESPAGACQLSAACQDATGRANFGFVSKYQKGASTPSGQTQFQFKAGGLSFHSSSYDWLVVAGARAQYKGSGTINGAGDFGFMLTAIDGQVSGGGGSDKFRIKIWDKATGAVVYDNQGASADDADPTTVIQGGSIVIHKA